MPRCVRVASNLSGSTGEAEKHYDSTIDANDVLVRKMPDAVLQLPFRDRRNLVNHDVTRGSEAVPLRGHNWKPHQRCIDAVSRQRADRDGGCRIEGVVLENDRWSGFAGVIRPSCNRPEFTALHSGGQSETESTNACSSRSNLSAPTSSDWRCASRAKLRDRTSGTQI